MMNSIMDEWARSTNESECSLCVGKHANDELESVAS